jgi:hypothetical protein
MANENTVLVNYTVLNEPETKWKHTESVRSKILNPEKSDINFGAFKILLWLNLKYFWEEKRTTEHPTFDKLLPNLVVLVSTFLHFILIEY